MGAHCWARGPVLMTVQKTGVRLVDLNWLCTRKYDFGNYGTRQSLVAAVWGEILNRRTRTGTMWGFRALRALGKSLSGPEAMWGTTAFWFSDGRVCHVGFLYVVGMRIWTPRLHDKSIKGSSWGSPLFSGPNVLWTLKKSPTQVGGNAADGTTDFQLGTEALGVHDTVLECEVKSWGAQCERSNNNNFLGTITVASNRPFNRIC